MENSLNSHIAAIRRGGLYRKICFSMMALALLHLSPLFSQTSLYIYNSNFETDADAMGVHFNEPAWMISNGSTSVTGGFASEFNYNGVPSPQGGNYVYGPYQGQGNLMDGIYNFTAVVGASFADSNAAPFTNWQDGEQYEIIYWFRPIEIRNQSDGSVWSMTFADDAVFQLFDANGNIFSNGTLNYPISSTGWTEFRVPILYDVDVWEGDAPLFYLSPQYSGWTQIDGPPGGLNPTLGSPSAIYSVAIDTGVSPVPEPSAAILIGLTSVMLLFLRKRHP